MCLIIEGVTYHLYGIYSCKILTTKTIVTITITAKSTITGTSTPQINPLVYKIPAEKAHQVIHVNCPRKDLLLHHLPLQVLTQGIHLLLIVNP